jgi:hypothetical protein
MWHRLKILMNEQDGSPGGGGSSGSPPPSDAQAQGQSGEPLTLEAIKALLTEHKNSVEANTRRIAEGIAGKRSRSEPRQGTETNAAPAPEPDMFKFLQSTRRLDVSDAQIALMEKAYRAQRPEDPDGWVAEYVEAFGIGKPGDGARNQTSSGPAPAPRPPVTAGGSPAASTTVTEDTPLFEMTNADRQRLIRDKGMNWYMRRLERDAKGRRFRIRPE